MRQRVCRLISLRHHTVQIGGSVHGGRRAPGRVTRRGALGGLGAVHFRSRERRVLVRNEVRVEPHKVTGVRRQIHQVNRDLDVSREHQGSRQTRQGNAAARKHGHLLTGQQTLMVFHQSAVGQRVAVTLARLAFRLGKLLHVDAARDGVHAVVERIPIHLQDETQSLLGLAELLIGDLDESPSQFPP